MALIVKIEFYVYMRYVLCIVTNGFFSMLMEMLKHLESFDMWGFPYDDVKNLNRVYMTWSDCWTFYSLNTCIGYCTQRIYLGFLYPFCAF